MLAPSLVLVPVDDLAANPARWRPYVDLACSFWGSELSGGALWASMLADKSYATFAACEDGRERALIVVHRQEDPTLKIVAVAGRRLHLVRRLWPRFLDLARYNGCTRISAGGRKGWARLTGMTITGRTPKGAWLMEKRL